MSLLEQPLSDAGAVSKGLVHRVAISEVYLTSLMQRAKNSYAGTAQWPRRHFFYELGEGKIDLELLTETLRQATIGVAHRFFDVPLGHQFLMDRICSRAFVARHEERPYPRAVEIEISVDEVRLRRDRLEALRSTVTFAMDGVTIGEGQGYLRVLDTRIYDRVRASGSAVESLPWPGSDAYRRASPRPIDRGVELVEIGAGELRWQLVIDLAHPVFFDHPLDHVPGMLVMEAARLAASRISPAGHSRLVAFDGFYESFLDLDEPILLSIADVVTSTFETTLTAVLLQRSRQAVRATLTVAHRD